MSDLTEQTFWQASESLRIAERELMRPNKDAVTLCACKCTLNSACGFFRSYLASRVLDDFQNSSLSDLQYQCAKIDPQFNNIDLSGFDCRNDGEDICDSNYCLSIEKVNKCFNQASNIRDFVMTKLNLAIKDLR